MAVIQNDGAGRYVEDLQAFIDEGDRLGEMLTNRAMEILGRENIESFGKGAIVGLDGEIEHGAAMNHVKFGNAMRRALGYPCRTIVPSTITGAPRGPRWISPWSTGRQTWCAATLTPSKSVFRTRQTAMNWSLRRPLPPGAGRCPAWVD